MPNQLSRIISLIGKVPVGRRTEEGDEYFKPQQYLSAMKQAQEQTQAQPVSGPNTVAASLPQSYSQPQSSAMLDQYQIPDRARSYVPEQAQQLSEFSGQDIASLLQAPQVDTSSYKNKLMDAYDLAYATGDKVLARQIINAFVELDNPYDRQSNDLGLQRDRLDTYSSYSDVYDSMLPDQTRLAETDKYRIRALQQNIDAGYVPVAGDGQLEPVQAYEYYAQQFPEYAPYLSAASNEPSIEEILMQRFGEVGTSDGGR